MSKQEKYENAIKERDSTLRGGSFDSKRLAFLLESVAVSMSDLSIARRSLDKVLSFCVNEVKNQTGMRKLMQIASQEVLLSARVMIDWSATIASGTRHILP